MATLKRKTSSGYETISEQTPFSIPVEIGITPTGTLSVTENGTYDVIDYASVNVNVSGSGATEPYIEETYNSNGYCTSMKFYGFNNNCIGNITNLTSIDWNSCTPKKIGEYAFYNCNSLTNLTIPNSVEYIGEYAFNNCNSLTNLTIPNSVTSIGINAFNNCRSLTNLTIPNSITSIGIGLFNNCSSLSSLTIPNSVTSIGGNAFYNCSSLTSLTMPNSVESIGGNVFYGCVMLKNLSLSTSLTDINAFAFYNSSKLSALTIPSSIRTIGNYAFYKLGSDKSSATVTFRGTPSTISASAFNQATKIAHIYVPWSSGAVANAPWGATNATIHYNS